MTLRDLPPLGLLLAFEAAGRLSSFKDAACELHLTPSAISQQIKALEESTGVSLFVRGGRAVTLTRAGATYLLDVQRALHELRRAGRRLQRPEESHVLRLTTAAVVAHEFLMPRLADFQSRFPDIDLHIEASTGVIDLDEAELDAAVRVGAGRWPGLTARMIGSVETAPVCAPSLAGQIRRASDLALHTLIYVRGHERGYEPFLTGELTLAGARRSLGFDSCFEALCAAQHGLGVAIGMFPVATPWVLDSRLAVPLPLREMLPGSAFLVHREADETRFPYRRIAQWLKDHYDALPMLPEGRLVAA
ncbi:MAG: LysR substrate-binding domain-containing protein [Polyangiales bacterium]